MHIKIKKTLRKWEKIIKQKKGIRQKKLTENWYLISLCLENQIETAQ